jgi:hypothetical protein
MKKTLDSHIFFSFTLILAISFFAVVFAQDDAVNEMIMRPQIKYKSADLRDPFTSEIVEKKKESLTSQKEGELNKPTLDLDALVVQGIIWGGEIPQAIINNKVLSVGSLINEAEILSIDKTGITLSFAGEIFNLSAPGKNSVLNKKE